MVARNRVTKAISPIEALTPYRRQTTVDNFIAPNMKHGGSKTPTR